MTSRKHKNNLIFILELILLINLILIPFYFLKDHLFVITSPSMAPELNVGDLVIRGNKAPEDIKVGEKDGDIVILKGPEYFYDKGFDPIFWNYLDNETPIIHRAIDKKHYSDKWYFLTKGDNNLVPDGALKFLNKSEDYILIEYNDSNLIYISETEILGVVIFKIPFIGYVTILSPIVFTFLIGFIVFYIVLKCLKYQIKIIRIN